VDPAQFARAWESSFAWEMMNYPVLTRRSNGHQQYLQGDRLAVYSGQGSRREVLSGEQKAKVMASAFGIDPVIIKKALEVIGNG